MEGTEQGRERTKRPVRNRLERCAVRQGLFKSDPNGAHMPLKNSPYYRGNHMNSIFKLNEKIENLPSILSIEDELFFINRLQKLPIEEIIKNEEIFKRIISAIQDSHQDNGIFEITDENINIFFEFVIWIRNLKKLYHLDFEKYIDGLDTNFDGSQQI